MRHRTMIHAINNILLTALFLHYYITNSTTFLWYIKGKNEKVRTKECLWFTFPRPSEKAVGPDCNHLNCFFFFVSVSLWHDGSPKGRIRRKCLLWGWGQEVPPSLEPHGGCEALGPLWVTWLFHVHYPLYPGACSRWHYTHAHTWTHRHASLCVC